MRATGGRAAAVRGRRAAVVAAVVALLALGAAAPARAAFAGVDGGALTYGAADGERNDVTITAEGAGYRVRDDGAALTAVAGCAATADPHVVTCAAATTIGVSLGDQDDRLAITAAAPAQVDGGTGDDVIAGGDGADHLLGGPGADTVSGGAGDDRMEEIDAAANRLDGGPGSDRLVGGDGPDVLAGGPGDDVTLMGGDGSDVIDGGEGDDVLDPGSGPGPLGPDADRLAGGPGFDRVTYALRGGGVSASIGNGPDDGAVGEGDDVAADVEALTGGQGPDTLTGGAGPDRLDGSGGGDTLAGGGGDDLLTGGPDSASDSLDGGPGADRLEGGGGEDRLQGGADPDTLVGGEGADDLGGGAGADALDGGTGDDALDGGADADRITGGDGTDTVRYDARSGPVEVTLDGVANDGEVTATADGRVRTEEGARNEGDDVDATTERVTGGGGDDSLSGDATANRIQGGAGEDVIDGGPAADDLAGGDRPDAIFSRDGTADHVSCGAGRDYVVADRRDKIDTGPNRCEYVDRGTRTKPRLRRDVAVAGACRNADADIEPPGMRRSVPVKRRALVPVGTRVDSLDCPVRLTVAAGRRARTARLSGGENRVTQGRRRTLLRTTDCPRARPASAVAEASRLPRRRYRRRYGRVAFPMDVQTDSARLRTLGRGAVSFEVDDRCGRGATVHVTSGRLAVVDLATDRRVVLGPGDARKVSPPGAPAR